MNATADDEHPKFPENDSAPEKGEEDLEDHELSKLFPSVNDEDRSEVRRRKRRGNIVVLVVIALLLSTIGAGLYVYRDKIPAALEFAGSLVGITPDRDFKEEEKGDEILFSIASGDYGSVIANRLVEQGIIKDERPFMEELLSRNPEPVFYPGTYSLFEQMTSVAALDALLDENNRVHNKALIREGISYTQALEILAETTEIPLEEFQKVAKDLKALGIPEEAPNLEGYLFPATYTLEPDMSAKDIIQMLVDKTFSVLEDFGVPEEEWHETLTMAGLIQREAGGFQRDDFFNVSQVFHNRIAEHWKLQSDASVSYGTGRTHTVWTTAEDRADASNKYNTYYHEGLPIGPISLPGELAIDAALHPTAGDYMFFMAVDLRTGETAFARTGEEHEKNVQRLAKWCQDTDNSSFCGR